MKVHESCPVNSRLPFPFPAKKTYITTSLFGSFGKSSITKVPFRR